MDVPLDYRQGDLLRRLIPQYGLGPRYIEFGCGDGFTMETLASLSLHGVGIDYSHDAIEIARAKNLPNTEFVEADFLKNEYSDEALIFLLNVLEHYDDDRNLLAVMNTYLRLGGHLGIVVPAHSRTYGPHDRLAGHYRRYDRPELIEKIEAAGFEIIELLTIGFPVGNLYTWAYNVALKLLGADKEFRPDNTVVTGVKDHGSHFPRPIQLVSGIAFPILRQLIRMDRPFQKTNLGNNYLALVKKVREVKPERMPIPPL